MLSSSLSWDLFWCQNRSTFLLFFDSNFEMIRVKVWGCVDKMLLIRNFTWQHQFVWRNFGNDYVLSTFSKFYVCMHEKCVVFSFCFLHSAPICISFFLNHVFKLNVWRSIFWMPINQNIQKVFNRVYTIQQLFALVFKIQDIILWV